MNLRLLSKVIGLLLLILAGTLMLCSSYAWWERFHGGDRATVQAFIASGAITFAAGLAMFLWGHPAKQEILRKEAIAIVGLGWLVCGAFGALPFLFAQPALNPAGAFFESMSGFSTTGATVIRDLDPYPRSILLWRSFTQWLGGLGILVLFVALLSYLGVGSKALFRHESSAKTGGGLEPRIHDVAVRLWFIYLGLSVACCLGLMGLGMTFYDALSHSFTAVSTGGFSPHNESIAYFDSVWIELWLVLFMALGGVSFMLYAWLLRGRWDRWRQDEETKVFGLILIGSTLVVAADMLLVRHHTPSQALREALFHVTSIMTTTGFATEDFDRWPPFSLLILIILMCVGGCTGSTAGGIKVNRWILFFKIVRVEILRAFRPNQIVTIHLNGKEADSTVLMQTVFFIALAGVTVSIGTALVSLLEPDLGLISCFTAVVATLFNIGPGLEAVGPTKNFADLGSATLILLSLLMVLGRLEFFAILVLFFPSLWKRY